MAWLLGALSLVAMAGCTASTAGRPPASAPPARGSASVATQASEPEGQSDAGSVTLTRLTPGVWLHTTTVEWRGVVVPSHGLVVEGESGVLLVDTAWGMEETVRLLEAIEAELGRPPDAAVVTHFHDDRAGGVRMLHDRRIPVFATARTRTRLSEEDANAVEHVLASPVDAAALDAFGVEVFYPGPGHTEDNVVVWLHDHRILFGGCLVRPGSSQDLGNTADADITRWGDSARAVAERYASATQVIPAHGEPASLELLRHTEELARAAAEQP